MLHDTHAHLDLLLQKLGDLPSERDLDLESGNLKHVSEFEIDKIKIHDLLSQHDFLIQPTVSTGNFWLAFTLFHTFSKVYFLLGSHPEIVNDKFNLDSYLDNQRDLLVEMESRQEMMDKLIGIGECGLDFHYSKDLAIHEKQIALFEEQIQLAIKFKLPLIIHCREAFPTLFNVLKEYPAIHGHFAVHCFTEGKETLKKIIDLGGKIGIGGIVTFKSASELQEAVATCPHDAYILETDLPFLAPDPYRSQVCMPDMVTKVAEKVATLQNEPIKEVWSCAQRNARELFGMFL